MATALTLNQLQQMEAMIDRGLAVGERHGLIDLVIPFGAEFPRAEMHPGIESSKAGV